MLRMASATPAAIKPYSIAVTPSRFFRNFRSMFVVPSGGRERRVSPLASRDVALYLSAVLTLENVVLRFDPKPWTVAMIATATPAAIKPYSIAVTPRSSRAKRKASCFIGSPFGWRPSSRDGLDGHAIEAKHDDASASRRRRGQCAESLTNSYRGCLLRQFASLPLGRARHWCARSLPS